MGAETCVNKQLNFMPLLNVDTKSGMDLEICMATSPCHYVHSLIMSLLIFTIIIIIIIIIIISVTPKYCYRSGATPEISQYGAE